MSQSVPLNRKYLDDHGKRVTVIRWDRAEQQVILCERATRMNACSHLSDLKRNLSESKYEHEPDGAGYEHQSG